MIVSLVALQLRQDAAPIPCGAALKIWSIPRESACKIDYHYHFGFTSSERQPSDDGLYSFGGSLRFESHAANLFVTCGEQVLNDSSTPRGKAGFLSLKQSSAFFLFVHQFGVVLDEGLLQREREDEDPATRVRNGGACLSLCVKAPTRPVCDNRQTNKCTCCSRSFSSSCSSKFSRMTATNIESRHQFV